MKRMIGGRLKAEGRSWMRMGIVSGGVCWRLYQLSACASAIAPSPSDREAVLAPIERFDVRVLESSPPQYVLNVRAGLPNGCAEKNRHDTERVAEAITVTVLNWMPKESRPCTLIYGSYELNINIGSDFRPGTVLSPSSSTTSERRSSRTSASRNH